MTPAGPSQAVAFSPATVNDPFASPNLPPPPSGPAWGLSGLSELSAGLPSTGPPSSGGMSSGGLQQRVQGSQGSVLGPGAQVCTHLECRREVGLDGMGWDGLSRIELSRKHFRYTLSF